MEDMKIFGHRKLLVIQKELNVIRLPENGLILKSLLICHF